MNAYAFLAIGVCMTWCAFPAIAQDQPVPPPSDNGRSESPSGDDVQAKPTQAPLRFDEYKVLEDISTLLANGQVKEAENELQVAIDQHPENHVLYSGHDKIADYLVSTNRSEEALVHLQADVDYWIGEVAQKIELMELFAEQLGKLVDLSARVGGLSRVEATLADCERKAHRIEGTQENPLAAITKILTSVRSLYLWCAVARWQ